MNHQEINTFFGTPLSETQFASRIIKVKIEYFIMGALIGYTIFLAIDNCSKNLNLQLRKQT